MFVRTASIVMAAAALFAGSAAQAAVINFGSAQDFSGPADVLNNGSAVRAYSFAGAGALSINSVSFINFATQSADTSSGFAGGNAFGGYGDAGQSGDYGTLLSNGIYNDGSATSITLNNLTKNHTYQIEVFVNDSRDCCGGDRVETFSGDTGGTAGIANFKQTATSGQFVVGSFLANGSSQVLNFDLAPGSTFNEQINGLVLRQTAVPEPASLALLASAAGLLTLRRKR